MSVNESLDGGQNPVPAQSVPPAGSMTAPTGQVSVGSFFTASISPVMVAAVMLVSSASVLAAGYAVDQTDYDLGPLVLGTHHVLPGKVLGTTVTTATIDDSSLEVQGIRAQISAKALNYDATIGRWNYNIVYSVPNSSGTVSISIGSFILAGNLGTSGTQETGAILKPGTAYHITLWVTDSSGNRQSVGFVDIKTKKGNTSSKERSDYGKCAQPQGTVSTSTPSLIGNPTLCIKKDDGSSQCVPMPCGFVGQKGNAGNGQGDFGKKEFDHPPINGTSTSGNLPPPPIGTPNGSGPANQNR